MYTSKDKFLRDVKSYLDVYERYYNLIAMDKSAESERTLKVNHRRWVEDGKVANEDLSTLLMAGGFIPLFYCAGTIKGDSLLVKTVTVTEKEKKKLIKEGKEAPDTYQDDSMLKELKSVYPAFRNGLADIIDLEETIMVCIKAQRLLTNKMHIEMVPSSVNEKWRDRTEASLKDVYVKFDVLKSGDNIIFNPLVEAASLVLEDVEEGRIPDTEVIVEAARKVIDLFQGDKELTLRTFLEMLIEIGTLYVFSS